MATAQPPINQQAQIVARVNDNHGRLVLLRRGYYNAVADQGFGFDKAMNKHNLTDPSIITAVVHNPAPAESRTRRPIAGTTAGRGNTASAPRAGNAESSPKLSSE
ncbi:hypothetical protein ABIA39_008504 [Nocardia sp. GAS34]|uniref:hypothetical protein n=1 Tax=unclassified Nocardia TaxID=2637762 RepID=UPI003D1F8228